MKRRILSLVLVVCMLASIMLTGTLTVSAASNFSEGFEEYTSTTTITRIGSAESNETGVYDTDWTLEKIDDDHGTQSVVFLSNSSGSNVPTYCPNWDNSSQTSGIAYYSFELYPYTTSSNRSFKIRGGGTNDYYEIIRFRNDGDIQYYEYNDGYSASSTLSPHVGTYSAEKWYKTEVYVDIDLGTYSFTVTCEGAVVASGSNIAFKGFTAPKRLKVVQSKEVLTGDSNKLSAIDNVVMQPGTKPSSYSNVVTGSTNVSLDQVFKYYFEDSVTLTSATATLTKTTDEGNETVELKTPVVAGSSVAITPAAALDEASSYKLIVNVNTNSGVYSYAADFTTEDIPDGAEKVTAFNLEVGDTTQKADLESNFWVSSGIGDTDDIAIENSGTVNGNMIKLPQKTDANGTVAVMAPVGGLSGTVIAEVTMFDTSNQNRNHLYTFKKDGNINVVSPVDDMVTHTAGSGLKARYNNNGTRAAHETAVMPSTGKYADFKIVMNIADDSADSTYSVYANGKLLESKSDVELKNIPSAMEAVHSFLVATWPVTTADAADYTYVDNIKVSYYKYAPELTAKVSGEVISSLADLVGGEVISVSAENAPAESKIIAAMYKDVDGIPMLVDVIFDDDTLIVPDDIATVDYSIKLMLWNDLTNIAPIMGSIEITK